MLPILLPVDKTCFVILAFIKFLYKLYSLYKQDLRVNIEGGSLSLCQFATKVKQEGGA